MAKIVIKNKITLEFLGEEYKDSYLEFKSMSISEYEGLLDQLNTDDNKESLKVTVKVLTDHFIDGKFLGEKVEAADLVQFDIQTLITCLEYFTGQKNDPKS